MVNKFDGETNARTLLTAYTKRTRRYFIHLLIYYLFINLSFLAYCHAADELFVSISTLEVIALCSCIDWS